MPKDISGTIEDAYQNYEETLESPEEAEKWAKEVLLQQEKREKEKESKASPKGQGRKRHPGSFRYSIVPLQGLDEKKSSTIREIVGLRFAGFSDTAIERELSLYSRQVRDYERKYPEGFEQAKNDLVTEVINDYQDGMIFVAGALGRTGRKAVQVLADEMVNYETGTAHTRLRSAELVLKMLFGTKFQHKNDAAEVIHAVTHHVATVMDKAKEHESYLVEAEVIKDEEHEENES